MVQRVIWIYTYGRLFLSFDSRGLASRCLVRFLVRNAEIRISAAYIIIEFHRSPCVYLQKRLERVDRVYREKTCSFLGWKDNTKNEVWLNINNERFINNLNVNFSRQKCKTRK